MPVVGLGTDIVEIERFADVARRDRLAKRVLTEFEWGEYQAHPMPERYLAKRFAAKEAAVKAFGTGIGNGVGWQMVEVSNLQSGQPRLDFSGLLAQLCQERAITNSYVSISDEQNYAVATVVLETN